MYKTMINKDVTRSARNLCQVIVFSAAAVLAVAPLAQAELVTNGSFEDTTNGIGQLGYNTTATGWSVADPSTGASYAFIFSSPSAYGTGSPGQYGNVILYGPPGNTLGASPDGGNFLGSDNAFQNGAITQTLSGLTDGDTYAVTFWWAAAQQAGYQNGTTSGWTVSLGGITAPQTVDTTIPQGGFSGWAQQTFDFTADGTSDVLSFLAAPPTNGAPPFSLLDGVSVTDTTTTSSNTTPEPGTWILMLTGILGALGVMRSRQWMKR
jgi:hypothetical protein